MLLAARQECLSGSPALLTHCSEQTGQMISRGNARPKTVFANGLTFCQAASFIGGVSAASTP
jgi:hypothetical protein